MFVLCRLCFIKIYSYLYHNHGFIIQTDQPFNMTTYVSPATLPDSSLRIPEGAYLTQVGYGYVDVRQVFFYFVTSLSTKYRNNLKCVYFL